jgi:hypothetical protein
MPVKWEHDSAPHDITSPIASLAGRPCVLLAHLHECDLMVCIYDRPMPLDHAVRYHGHALGIYHDIPDRCRTTMTMQPVVGFNDISRDATLQV